MSEAEEGLILPPDPPGWSPEKRQDLRERTLVSGARIIRDDLPSPGFLVDGMIPGTGVVVMVGEAGVGKSWVAYDLIRAVTTGTPWLGRSKPACGGKPFPVILFNYDAQVHELQRRLRRLGMTGEEPFHCHTHEFTKGGMIRLSLDDKNHAMEGVCALIEDTEAALVVFDSMRQSHTAEEDSNLQMGEIMAQFKSLCSPLPDMRCTTLILHHTPKGLKGNDWQTKARGSGEIVAQAEVEIQVTATKLFWNKVRGWRMPPGASAQYRIVDEGDRTNLMLVGDPPGMTDAECRLSQIVKKLEREECPMGKDELRAGIGATRAVMTEAVIQGVRDGVLTACREGRTSSKILIGLTSWGLHLDDKAQALKDLTEAAGLE